MQLRFPAAQRLATIRWFFFAQDLWHATIEDFHQGRDLIDLTQFASAGIHAMADRNLVSWSGGSALTFANGGDVTVVGVPGSQASDFRFG